MVGGRYARTGGCAIPGACSGGGCKAEAERQMQMQMQLHRHGQRRAPGHVRVAVRDCGGARNCGGAGRQNVEKAVAVADAAPKSLCS